MKLSDKVRQMLVFSMKRGGGDTVEKNILRYVLGEIDRYTMGCGDALSEEKIVRKVIKENESTLATLHAKGVSGAVVDKLKIENSIMKEILPEMWGSEKIKAFVTVTLAEKIVNAKTEGMAIGLMMKELKEVTSSVDGNAVRAIVTEIRNKIIKG
jgi:uncharacterized protein YqeY